MAFSHVPAAHTGRRSQAARLAGGGGRLAPLPDHCQLDECDLVPGIAVDVCKGTQLDIVLELGRQSSGRIALELFRPMVGRPATTIKLDLVSGELRCGDKSTCVPCGDGDRCTLRVIVDRSVVEV